MQLDLRHGDCLDILPTLPDKSVDAIITDLPYGTTACKWDVIIPLVPMWEQVRRLCKGAFVTTASQPFTSVLIMSNLQWFKYEWIWLKNVGSNFASTKYQPMKEHENVLVFAKGATTYAPIMQERAQSAQERFKYRLTEYKGNKRDAVGNLADNGPRRLLDPSERVPSSYQYFDVVPRYSGTLHPTQKPVALYEYLIRTYTNEGDTVLDFCMGSGTTGVACVKTGRNFIGIEKERNYFEIAERRVQETQQQMMMPL